MLPLSGAHRIVPNPLLRQGEPVQVPAWWRCCLSRWTWRSPKGGVAGILRLAPKTCRSNFDPSNGRDGRRTDDANDTFVTAQRHHVPASFILMRTVERAGAGSIGRGRIDCFPTNERNRFR